MCRSSVSCHLPSGCWTKTTSREKIPYFLFQNSFFTRQLKFTIRICLVKGLGLMVLEVFSYLHDSLNFLIPDKAKLWMLSVVLRIAFLWMIMNANGWILCSFHRQRSLVTPLCLRGCWVKQWRLTSTKQWVAQQGEAPWASPGLCWQSQQGKLNSVMSQVLKWGLWRGVWPGIMGGEYLQSILCPFSLKNNETHLFLISKCWYQPLVVSFCPLRGSGWVCKIPYVVDGWSFSSSPIEVPVFICWSSSSPHPPGHHSDPGKGSADHSGADPVFLLGGSEYWFKKKEISVVNLPCSPSPLFLLWMRCWALLRLHLPPL